MLKVTAALAVLAGLVMIAGGTWGIMFTYTNVKAEKITTSKDASIPGVPVRGPFTLKAQADVIRMHTLESTGGKTFAEMPRQIAKLDSDGKPVLGADGKPVMIPNTARDMWYQATTLTTALHLGIITYAFLALVLFLGFISIWTGFTFFALSKKY